MLTSCPYCTTDTAGNHDSMCPYYHPIQPNVLPDCTNPNVFVNTFIPWPPDLYKDIIKFLESFIGNCNCKQNVENYGPNEIGCSCKTREARDLLDRLKGT